MNTISENKFYTARDIMEILVNACQPYEVVDILNLDEDTELLVEALEDYIHNNMESVVNSLIIAGLIDG